MHNKVYNIFAKIGGSTLEVNKLRNLMDMLETEFANMQQGRILKSAYEALQRQVPDVTSYAYNLKAFRQALTGLDDYITRKAANISNNLGSEVAPMIMAAGGFNEKVSEIFESKDNKLNLVLNKMASNNTLPKVKILSSGQKMYLQSNGTYSTDKPYGFVDN